MSLKIKPLSLSAIFAFATLAVSQEVLAAPCDQACLEKIGDAYRAAYLAHDPKLAPIAKTVRFTENNVVLHFPDGTWDTVTKETGPTLTFSDPQTGSVGIYTSTLQTETPGFLAARLKVKNGEITEIEHMMVTRRWVSTPPPVFGDPTKLVHDPELTTSLKDSEKRPRAEMIRIADGYFSTLEKNNGVLKTTFAANCHRVENGLETAKDGCDKAFKLGVYGFNNRVRDRDYFLVDEKRGLVMSRAYIDHKGVMQAVKLTDGTERSSVFKEPHTWSVLEVFKIKNGAVGPIETDFIGTPYYTPSPWPAQIAADRH